MPLPTGLYSAAQVRALDAYAIEQLGVPGYTLMKRAGEAALRYLRSRWPTAYRVVIVCGSGNNGGDGYVLGRFAQAAGLTVTVLSATPPSALKGDALSAYNDCVTSGARIQPFAAQLLKEGELIVDALLGTGLKSVIREELVPVVHAINASGRPVFALDIPSGLDSDTGIAHGEAVRADCTVSFVGLKTGLMIGDGPEYAGTLYFDDLEVVPPAKSGQFSPRLERILETEILQALPRRRRAAHKGDFGKVLIVGSGPSMPGATRLAGEACLRVGAGLVTVAVAPENLAAIASGRPELICLPFREAEELSEAIDRAQVIAVGPGLGRSSLGAGSARRRARVGQAARHRCRCAEPRGGSGEKAAICKNCILTPHPGEASRLLGVDTDHVQHDRLTALGSLVEALRCNGGVERCGHAGRRAVAHARGLRARQPRHGQRRNGGCAHWRHRGHPRPVS